MSVRVDKKSLVADVDAALTLAEVEETLRREGLTLDLAGDAKMGDSIDAWIAGGLAGTRDPFRDPVDHVVSGLDAKLTDGGPLRIRPGPRRAVGPDLVSLFVGTNGRYGTVTRAHLRVHPVGVSRPDAAPFHPAPPAAPNDGEKALFDAIARELGARADR